MINHARTLLINRAGIDQADPEAYGAEYVPEDFVPVRMFPALTRVWNVLFAPDADGLYLNFRVWQYLKILHATPYVSYALMIDPRVTYTLDRSLMDYRYGVTVYELSFQAKLAELKTFGHALQRVTDGKLVRLWSVQAIAGPTVRVTNNVTKVIKETAVNYNQGCSDLFVLHGKVDTFKARILSRSDSLDWPLGAEWLISSFLFPDLPISDVVANLESVSDSLNEVFGINQEPYTVFRNLWETKEDLHSRLSGVLLAVIYRLEESRLNG